MAKVMAEPSSWGHKSSFHAQPGAVIPRGCGLQLYFQMVCSGENANRALPSSISCVGKEQSCRARLLWDYMADASCCIAQGPGIFCLPQDTV